MTRFKVERFPRGSETEKLHILHPQEGSIGSLQYVRHPDHLQVEMLSVKREHQGHGYASQLMDELQRRNPGVPLDHGERTDPGQDWWDSYSQGKDVAHGRTMAALGAAVNISWDHQDEDPATWSEDYQRTARDRPHGLAVNQAQEAARRQVPTMNMNLGSPNDATHAVQHMMRRGGHPDADEAFVMKHPHLEWGQSQAFVSDGQPGIALHPSRWDYGTAAHEVAHHLHEHELGHHPTSDEEAHGPDFVRHYQNVLGDFGRDAAQILGDTYHDSLRRLQHEGILRAAGYSDYIKDAWNRRAEQYPDDADSYRERAQREHDYESSLPGHHVGDSWERPEIGWVRTEEMGRFREHAGTQHSQSRAAVDALADDFRDGVGWHAPLHLYYNAGTQRASLGEGNHRLKAAEEAGVSHVPVIMHPHTRYGGDMPSGGFMPLAERKPPPPSTDAYHPSHVVPARWMHGYDPSATYAFLRQASKWTFEHFQPGSMSHRMFGGPSEDPRRHMVEYDVRPEQKIKFGAPDSFGGFGRVERKGGPEVVQRMREAIFAQHPGHTEWTPQDEPQTRAPRKPRVYYHGTTVPDVTHVLPANEHGQGVVFPHVTDPDYAYATSDHGDAWNYAEKAWSASAHGRPRVYQVKPIGGTRHVETDPHDDQYGQSRGNYENDYRSPHGWQVVKEMPFPKHMGDPKDWEN
jgi:GNAT superfamily N-acetyltransferase